MGKQRRKFIFIQGLLGKNCKYILFYYCYKENGIKMDPIGWCCTKTLNCGLDNDLVLFNTMDTGC